MAMMLAGKKEIVSAVKEVAENAVSVVAVENRGLTVSQMTGLRAEARQNNLHIKIVRNTLAKRALADTKFACLDKALTGPICLIFSNDTPSAGARLVRDFIKDNDKLLVRALSVGDALLGADSLDAIASLPTRDEAIAKLLYVMKAPVEKFVRTLAAPHTKLVRTIAAVRDQKQEAA